MPIRAAQRRDRLHRWAWASVDATIWFVAVLVATWLRFDYQPATALVDGTLLFAGVAAVVHVLAGALIGPYAVGHQRGSFEEAADLARTVALVTVCLAAWALSARPLLVPRSVPVVAGAVALGAMFAVRFVTRSWRNRHLEANTHQRRVIVFGAGDAGRRLVRNMHSSTDSGFFPVALLDDDTDKRRLTIDGVRVRGTREDIEEVAQAFGASALVVALPQANAALIRDLSDRAAAAGLAALVLPPLRDIIGGRPTSHDLRDVNVQDLLGRRPISLDTRAIAEAITGRSVLVTGAGGSIGSELCRQIARFGPAKLYLLDRDESGLQDTHVSLTGRGLVGGDEVVLADIRDRAAIRAAFASSAPDLVFHAAALKHLPVLEAYPLEAWKTNVLGTLNVLSAAAEVGVGTFVNISTDKAADPTTALGCSKRLAERLTAGFARAQTGRYVSVRFGNVLGSRGSVVPVFTAQIERGGPVTVTHPDVERYFMLIPEACELVLEAGAIGPDGEVMVLDMGEPVRIVDVARTLIGISGRRDVEINFTGLRPGEKLTEQLFSRLETPCPTTNSLITSVSVPELGGDEVESLRSEDDASAVEWMQQAAQPAWTPAP